MARRRGLSGGEIELARRAFGDAVAYARVKLGEGAGLNFAARIAFAKGNPAITLGSTVYFKRDFTADFAAPGINPNGFMHEMTHVWQFQRLGLTRFLLRYGRELARVGGKAAEMYRYEPGVTRFEGAMLEAQAQMVGDYAEALWAGRKPHSAARAKNLAGSGLYGL